MCTGSLGNAAGDVALLMLSAYCNADKPKEKKNTPGNFREFRLWKAQRPGKTPLRRWHLHGILKDEEAAVRRAGGGMHQAKGTARGQPGCTVIGA